MNQGYARFEIEQETPDTGSPPSSGVRGLREADPPSSRREIATVSYRDAAMTLPAIELDDPPFLSWCVDHGDRMATMTTFELWTALDRHDLGPHLRVWREGMECWTPAGEVPELRCALASVPPPPPPVETTPVTMETTTPAAAETTDARTNPTLRSAEVKLAPRAPVLPREARGPFWMGLGSAVAALAIAVALAATSRGGPEPEAIAPVVIAAPVAPAEAPTAAVGEEVPAAWATSAPKPPRREEPGQRRRRQGVHGR